MASIVTVTIKYEDSSRSYSESFTCADNHPSAYIVKQLEEDTREQWIAMGGTLRGAQIHTKVR